MIAQRFVKRLVEVMRGAANESSESSERPVNSTSAIELRDAEAGNGYDPNLALLDESYDVVSDLSKRAAPSSSSNSTGSSGSSGGKHSYLKLARFSPIGGCRSWLIELLTFAGWCLLGIPSALQPPLLWFVFWQYVCRLGGGHAIAPSSVHVQRVIARKALPLWLLWALAAYYYRRTYRRHVPVVIGEVIRHLELFVSVSLLVTLSANFCSFVHTPATPLFDLGFLVIPEQSPDSAWRPVSDVLAQALPAALILRSLFLRRPMRCQTLINWLRCVSLGYLFRCLTVTLTSLPGPAPHCNNAEGYHPPQGWHDIATRLGPMVGDYSTCGDLIFSGHTAFTTMTMLCLVKTFRGRPGYTAARILGPLYVATMCTLALAGRKHYSVDIAVAVLVSALTFYRFQDGWVARPAPGAGLSDDELMMTRKNTIDLPHDSDFLPLHSNGHSSRQQGSRLQIV